MPDQSDRPALDPPGDVGGFDRDPVDIQHPARVMRDDPGMVIEREVGQVRGEVTHRAIHGLNRPVGEFAGSPDGSVTDELGPFGTQALHAIDAQYRRR
ncbi:Uncharacterised protein [Mycobacteroides abscessus subsp. abscessus]|nr:Uncharacterised protein [Mycobacteroides abscessus subsp. abscessus]